MGLIGAAIRALVAPRDPNYNANAHNVGTVQYVPTHTTDTGYYIAPQHMSYHQRKCERRAERQYRRAERTMDRAEMRADRDFYRAERMGGFCGGGISRRVAVVPVVQQQTPVMRDGYARDLGRTQNQETGYYAEDESTSRGFGRAPTTARDDAPPAYEERQK